MNWDALGAIGELIGSLAVFLTLIYLAVQTRQTSKLLRATIREQRTESSHRLQFFAAERFADDDQARLIYHNAMFRDWDTYARQRKEGLIDDEEWGTQMIIWNIILNSDPSAKEAWLSFGGGYSTDLRSAVTEALATEVPENRIT